MPEKTTGERIRARRLDRGWSLTVVADRAGITASTLSRIERGLRGTNNRHLISDLAAALEWSVADLTGQPYVPADRQLEAAHARIANLRTAVAETTLELAPVDGHEPAPMAQLEQRAELVIARGIATDYAAVTDLAPALLIDLHAHAKAGNRRAAELVVNLGTPISPAFRYLGYLADSALLTERVREYAEWLGQPVPLAIADFLRANASAAIGFRRSAAIAEQARVELDRHTDEPGALDMLGMLHLTGAQSAVGQGRRGEALDRVAEARAIAERTGQTSTAALFFGPANVTVWELGLRVDADEPGKAVEVAAGADVTALPKIRQGYFWLDLSRAYTAMGKPQRERAVRALLTAERAAPQFTRSAPLARETARALRAAGGDSRDSALRGLCERLGV
ncbi:helix-turn-helix domain-containing protein [Cryptosporangium arvum]|uniref:Putative transcriptional regulator n=1 Tax=Cryptosporangium arvum DSM 44712 TaxID=927661 RepID=A0A010YIE0_9ACTN|nr:helix-turn-helix transcriptional regulator [Cryptosporangium arvum]EXG80030.1 putative transcriptional regulator [Cryptosporangium arvum DSM 44712]